MESKSNTILNWLAFVSLIWLALWLTLINPDTAHPVLLLIPFILIVYLLYYALGWTTLHAISARANKLNRRQSIICWFLSIMVGLFFVLSSLGQLNIKDGATVVGIALLGLLYITKLLPIKD